MARPGREVFKIVELGGRRFGVVGSLSLPGYRSRQQRLRRKPLVTLPAQYHETIIIPVHSPGSRRYFAEIDKFPIAGVEAGKAKVISDCRRDIQAGGLV